MDLSGGSSRSFAPGLERVVVSTLCVQDNLVAAGGFNGDLVIRNTSQQEPVCRSAKLHVITIHAMLTFLLVGSPVCRSAKLYVITTYATLTFLLMGSHVW